MARIRTVKPELARHRELYDLEKSTGIPMRYVWALFPTVCDREGRFVWRPWEIKLDIMPYDDVDFAAVMDALWGAGFLVKFTSGGVEYGAIPTFLKHQVVNNREVASKIPAPSDQNCQPLTRGARVGHASRSSLRGREGKGRELEGKGTEHELRPRVNTPTRVEETDGQEARRKVWNAYREAYFARHKVEPVRNAKANALVKQFVSRLGEADAAAVIQFYVSHNDSQYVRNVHSLDFAVRDAEPLRTQWARGKQITQVEVRNFEKQQNTRSLFEAIDKEGV